MFRRTLIPSNRDRQEWKEVLYWKLVHWCERAWRNDRSHHPENERSYYATVIDLLIFLLIFAFVWGGCFCASAIMVVHKYMR
jgi:hypothetical protein